jgi:hypothetical protein
MSMSSARLPTHGLHYRNARLTTEHPYVVKIGRASRFVKGSMYLIAGFLALSVAVEARGWSNGSQDASPSGALKTVTASGVGNVLLWLLAIGMLLYSAWRVVSTLLPRGDDPRALAHRLGYVVSALIYTVLTVSAIALLRRAPGTADGTKKLTDITASMITHAVGRVAVGVVGAMVVGLGVYRFYKGVTMDAREELDVAGMSAARVVWTERLGLIGEIGRGIGISLVGIFMLRSAIIYRAAQVAGLDAALRRLAVESWGSSLVVVFGIGFAAYGVFCMATFTHRRLLAP